MKRSFNMPSDQLESHIKKSREYKAGFVTNIEGLLNRVKYQIEVIKETSDDNADRKKAKNLLKKIYNIKLGTEKQKIIIEDPSGNSAIVSDKAKKDKLKVKK